MCRARGMFITVEGIDGSGKSTLIDGLKQVYGDSVTFGKSLDTATVTGSIIRDVILNNKVPLTDMAIVKLLEADRELASNGIDILTLEVDRTLIYDRWYHSTIAYQGVSLGVEWMDEYLYRLHDDYPEHMLPDLTLVLDVDAAVAYPRSTVSDVSDRFDERGMCFMHEVGDNYRYIAGLDESIRLIPSLGVSETLQTAINYINEERGL